MESIFLQFYLDPDTIALTHAENWEPSLVVRHGGSPPRSRLVKLALTDLEFDHTFWMPTRLRLGATELFVCSQRAHPRMEAFNGPGPSLLPEGHAACPWRWCPVIALAVNALEWALPQAVDWGEQSMMMGDNGDLVFRVDGTDVAVEYWDVYAPNLAGPASRPARHATVGYADLLEAWEAFAEDVRTQFLAVLPELADNEEYGPWFREGLAYLRRQPT
ncbi:MAG: hypothetical protein ACJ789_05255 [Thermomicrobiales bacterium]